MMDEIGDLLYTISCTTVYGHAIMTDLGFIYLPLSGRSSHGKKPSLYFIHTGIILYLHQLILSEPEMLL